MNWWFPFFDVMNRLFIIKYQYIFDPKQILSPIYNKSIHWKIYCKLFVLSFKVESYVHTSYVSVYFWTSKLWKFDIFLLRTEDQAFILIFVRKKTEFLTAKHWLSWLKVTQKLRKTVLKKVNTECQENKIQIAGCSELYMGFYHRESFTTVSFHQFKMIILTTNTQTEKKYFAWTKLLFHKFLVSNC